jgi:hypothetical protein
MASTINGTSTGNGGLISTGDDSGILNIQTNETTAITVDASQRVGIGTASPNDVLEVAGNDAYIRVNRTGNEPGILLTYSNSGTNRGNIAVTSGGAMYFTSGGNTERMRIDSSGNVGIGTSPNAKLEVNGQIRSSGTTAQAIYIYGAASTTPYITINQFGVRSWDIGAGYYSSGTFSIQSGQVNGVYLGATATSWASASDERLKDIIEPIDNALTKVDGLRSVIGKYKTDEEGVRRSFLIAQDIQTQFPEALESSDPDKLGVQYTDVIPLLVASIKELKAINDTQAETINALTARIVALESRGTV